MAVTEEATLENFSLPSCQGQENILALHSEGGRLENPDANSFIHLYIQRCFLSACYCRAGPVLNAKDDSQGQHRQGPSALVPRWRNKQINKQVNKIFRQHYNESKSEAIVTGALRGCLGT